MKKDFKNIYSLYFKGYTKVDKSTYVNSKDIKLTLLRPKKLKADWKSFYLKERQ